MGETNGSTKVYSVHGRGLCIIGGTWLNPRRYCIGYFKPPKFKDHPFKLGVASGDNMQRRFRLATASPPDPDQPLHKTYPASWCLYGTGANFLNGVVDP